jgi:hypothetical protein
VSKQQIVVWSFLGGIAFKKVATHLQSMETKEKLSLNLVTKIVSMKKLFSFLVLSVFVVASLTSCAQIDKSKRPSPPAKVTQTISNGTTVSIDYSQPSLKGRTVGKDVEPMDGKIWRAGANEATVFEVNKDVKIECKALPAGKYALFMIAGPGEWTIIFNKKWDTDGAFDYEKNKIQDALRVKVKPMAPDKTAEKLTYFIDKNGTVSLVWGDKKVAFKVS